MKKILSILLLLSFCTVQISWAGEAIIIGSDGQARYENDKNDVIMEKSVKTEGDSKNMEKDENIFDIKDIENTGSYKYDYNDYFEEIIKQAPKFITDYKKLLNEQGYQLVDKFSSDTNNEYLKLNLLDGDYAISKELSAEHVPDIMPEYHKDGTLMGLIKNGQSSSKWYSYMYDYRIGYKTKNGMGLKHIVIYSYDHYGLQCCYIYNANGRLLYAKNYTHYYIAKDTRNFNLKQKPSVEYHIKRHLAKEVKQTAGDIAAVVTVAPLLLIFDVFNLWGDFGK